jgi:asparagine synthase (glutamine-hydrolysing)
MCGIIYYLSSNSYDINMEDIKNSIDKLELRGPDNSQILEINKNNKMGFTRLSINDLSPNGNQPLVKNDRYYLICNGEIYNHKILIKKHNFVCDSLSDCEVIINMYEKYGIEKLNEMLRNLDGVFAFVLYDKLLNTTIISRDPYGVRPLFIGYTKNNELLISSEVKAICNISKYIIPFKPGNYAIINQNENNKITYNSYHNYKFDFITDDYNTIKNTIKKLLIQAVDKRLMSDRPIGCLLSGGLDSSLVSALVAKHYEPYTLNTFSIGMKDSTDLYYAKLAAKYIKSNHHSIELTNQEFLDTIKETIYITESYDITTIRASVGNYLVGKYIKNNTNCKVIYNGDGSEEIFGSYKWFSLIDNEHDFFLENLKLLREIYYYDVLRSDRSISDNGLETRVPFLDKTFVDYIMRLPPKYKMFNKNIIEKNIIREAFDDMNILPKEVLWRKKEAFSDGVSSKEKSWFKIIQDDLNKKITTEEFIQKKSMYIHNSPISKEALYYREIFETYFPNHSNIIPHFWMPNKKWCNVNDPSARVINK